MLKLDPLQRPSILYPHVGAQQLMQIPLISLRLKERQLKDRYTEVKQKEDELKKREAQLRIR